VRRCTLEEEGKCCGVEEEKNKKRMPSVGRCMSQYLAKHAMSSTRSLFELEQGTPAATKEHGGQDSRNGLEFGPDDILEAEVGHVLAVVVNGEPAERLGIKLEVCYRCHVVRRRVLVDLARLGDERNVELQ
jgi:hypothetical protein